MVFLTRPPKSDFLTPVDLFEFYRHTFLPAYSDVVGFTATKHQQFLIELENTLAHVAQYHNPTLNNAVQEENLKKAYDHLTRVTLDCYKMLWVEMDKELKGLYLDEKKRTFALNISEEDFLKGYNNFKQKAQNARTAELESIGSNPLAPVDLYKEAIIIGKGLINSVDNNKLQKLKRYRNIVFVKETGIALGIGFIAGILANAVWGFAPLWDSIRSNYNAFTNYIINILYKN
jgi:hypothetical protein